MKDNREKILEILKEERDLGGIDWKEKEKRINKFRDLFYKKMEETREYMKKSGKD